MPRGCQCRLVGALVMLTVANHEGVVDAGRTSRGLVEAGSGLLTDSLRWQVVALNLGQALRWVSETPLVAAW